MSMRKLPGPPGSSGTFPVSTYLSGCGGQTGSVSRAPSPAMAPLSLGDMSAGGAVTGGAWLERQVTAPQAPMPAPAELALTPNPRPSCPGTLPCLSQGKLG